MPLDPIAGQIAADKARESTRKALEEAGITMKVLTDALKAELEATETKFFAFQGSVEEEREVISWDVRQKARMDAHRLRGDYPKEQIDVEVRPMITFDAPETESDVAPCGAEKA